MGENNMAVSGGRGARLSRKGFRSTTVSLQSVREIKEKMS